MKKIQKIALVLIIILAIILGLTYTTFAVTGKITVETVRVREEATTESKTLVMGNLGEEVEVIGQEGDWYKVKYNEQEGYIYKDYVETTEPVEETPETTENPQTKPDTTTTEETNTSVATELGNTLNKDSSAYLLPNYTSTKIAELKQSEQVKIISTLAIYRKLSLMKFQMMTSLFLIIYY